MPSCHTQVEAAAAALDAALATLEAGGARLTDAAAFFEGAQRLTTLCDRLAAASPAAGDAIQRVHDEAAAAEDGDDDGGVGEGAGAAAPPAALGGQAFLAAADSARDVLQIGGPLPKGR